VGYILSLVTLEEEFIFSHSKLAELYREESVCELLNFDKYTDKQNERCFDMEMLSINRVEVLDVIFEQNYSNIDLSKKLENNFIVNAMLNNSLKIEYDLNDGITINSIPYSEWWDSLNYEEKDLYLCAVDLKRQETLEKVLDERLTSNFDFEQFAQIALESENNWGKNLDNTNDCHGDLLFNIQSKKAEIKENIN